MFKILDYFTKLYEFLGLRSTEQRGVGTFKASFGGSAGELKRNTKAARQMSCYSLTSLGLGTAATGSENSLLFISRSVQNLQM